MGRAGRASVVGQSLVKLKRCNMWRQRQREGARHRRRGVIASLGVVRTFATHAAHQRRERLIFVFSATHMIPETFARACVGETPAPASELDVFRHLCVRPTRRRERSRRRADNTTEQSV